MLVSKPQRITHQELLILAQEAKGSINHLYLHWTAGNYGQAYDDYHINIDKNGEVYQTCSSLTEKKPHTWRRNSGAVGIALCGACGAVYGGAGNLSFGSAPPTTAQLRSMAWVIAFLCMALGLAIAYPVVMTHGEAAMADGYGPGSGDPETRWDLLWAPDVEEKERFRQGGVMLRQLAQVYAQRLKPGMNEVLQVPLVLDSQ